MATIQVNLSRDAKKALASTAPGRNGAGVALRDWVIRRFECSVTPRALDAPLFATTVEVADDVPLLLEALARVTGETQDELIEAWAHEPMPSEPEQPPEQPATCDTGSLPEDTRAKLIELLDLAETLFEETVSDVEQRFGPYPQGKQAGASAEEIYRALRSLLKITGVK
jgi:hypothetical protein